MSNSGNVSGTTFWRSEVEKCPECGDRKVWTNGDTRWCGPCGWSEEVPIDE